MPSVLRVGRYRFFFYAGDFDEPPHIHVECENKIAKFWLDPIRLHKSGGFNRIEINRIYKIIQGHQEKLMEEWDEYFGN